MKLRTGLKVLIGISVLGIAITVFLIYTCPFAGQVAFSTLVRQVPVEHGGGPAEHAPRPGGETQKPHGEMRKHEERKEEHHENVKGYSEAVQKPHEAVAEHREEGKGLKVHFMMIPDVRSYPVKETKVFGIEISPLGIIVLLLLIALCTLMLRQRSLSLFGYAFSPRAMGVTVFLMTLWNLAFAAFLLGVEIFELREL